jgi:mRNA-degrading endonuclease RelE of RelBE toxin-antitoxin system
MASYRVEVRRQAADEIRRLPGHARPGIMAALKSLTETPQPPRSRPLDVARAGIELPAAVTLWRVRLDPWRIVYAVDNDDRRVVVLAVRRRPPYRYEDLPGLAEEV